VKLCLLYGLTYNNIVADDGPRISDKAAHTHNAHTNVVANTRLGDHQEIPSTPQIICQTLTKLQVS